MTDLTPKPKGTLELTPEKRAVLNAKLEDYKNRKEFALEDTGDGNRSMHIVMNEPQTTFTLAQAFGTLDAGSINVKLTHLQSILPSKDANAVNNIVAQLYGLAPQNELESMLAAQIVATNHVAMRMLARSLDDNTLEVAGYYTNRAHKAQNVLLRQMDLLRQMRQAGISTQRVVVEKVEVQAGGQAVVGAVAGCGGSKPKTEE
ncbi:MAG: hypothetical protein WAZ18_03610 [Alphaproteobacteria bacterium]